MQVVCPRCLMTNRVPKQRLADRPICGKCRAPLLPPEPLALTDATFDRYVGNSDVPVLTDFWAEWCGPCKTMNPILAQLAADRPDIRVAKVNTESEPQLARRFNIRSIPLLVLMRRGAELGRLSGARPAAQLSEWIAATLRQSPEADGS